MPAKSLQLCLTLCDPMNCLARQALLSMEFSRQEYCSELPCPPPGDLPNSGIESRSLTLQADPLPSEPPGKPRNTGVGSLFPSPRDLPNPGIEPGSPLTRKAGRRRWLQLSREKWWGPGLLRAIWLAQAASTPLPTLILEGMGGEEGCCL